MSRYAYVNGRYVRHSAAFVHIDDRGYQFADGIYEVVAIHDGGFVEMERHMARLRRSLNEMRMALPVSEAALSQILARVVRLNMVRNGSLYLQVTRGVAPRDHAFAPDLRAQIVITAKRMKPQSEALAAKGVDVITIPDIRWGRCDIKSIALLPNILGKQQAREAGAYEAWQVDAAGFVTEGTSSNAWIVSEAGAIVTRPAAPAILNGVTRLVVRELADEQGLKVEERGFTVAEAQAGREAFLTSTTSHVLPVTRIDGKPVSEGVPGAFSRALRARYLAKIGVAGPAL